MPFGAVDISRAGRVNIQAGKQPASELVTRGKVNAFARCPAAGTNWPSRLVDEVLPEGELLLQVHVPERGIYIEVGERFPIYAKIGPIGCRQRFKTPVGNNYPRIVSVKTLTCF